MKVAVLAFTVKGAMGQYLHCLLQELGRRAEVSLVAPSHYAYSCGSYRRDTFVTGVTKAKAAAALLNPLSIAGVFRRISNSRPDVVHLFNGEGYPAALCCPFVLRRWNVPLVTTIHDVKPHSGDPLMRAVAVLRRGLVRSSKIVHIHSKRHLEQLEPRIDVSRIRVIPHGSFAPIYNPSGTLRPAPARPAVLFFGRLQEYKGVDILVRAARSLAPEIKVIIAGPGRLSPSVMAEIRGSERFELHNRFLADKEVSSLFRRASVTVLPYRDATQSSVPLISASFGVPIVATNVGAFVEEIPQLGGLLVPPGDHEALAKAVTQSLGSSAVHPPEFHFSSLAGRYLEMYASALGE